MIHKVQIYILFIMYTIGLNAEEDFSHESAQNTVQRLWGVPDTTAHVGYLFHYQIPKDAFNGKIARFKASNENGGPLAEWLTFTEKNGILEGLPNGQDLGEHYITVKAFDSILRGSVKDVFAIEVLSTPPDPLYMKECKQDEQTVLTVVLDLKVTKLSVSERVQLIKHFANYFNINTELLRLRPMEDKDEPLFHSYITAGPGNIKNKTYLESTVLQWQMGCKEKWEKYSYLIERVRKTARDGTLSKILLQPVVGWSVGTETLGVRKRRQVNGNSFHLQTLNDEIVVDEGVPEQRIVVPNTVTPAFTVEPSPEIVNPTDLTSHHHRHHHGDTIAPFSWPIAPSVLPSVSIIPTPTYIPERPNIDKSDILISEDLMPTISLPSPEPSSAVYTKEMDITDYAKWSNSFEENEDNEEATPPLPNITSTVTDETIIAAANMPPTIVHRLQKVAITAGKILKYQIPEDTFIDAEDGNTRNLKLQLRKSDGEPFTDNSWIRLNEVTQEIQALPLEEHVSKWDFIIDATDSGGLSVEDSLDLSVQQHKARRTVNHALTAVLQEIPSGPILDWQLAFTERIAQLYGDRDTTKLTVLEIDEHFFTWTNDSLSRAGCPRKEIEALYKTASGEGGLKGAVLPGLVVSEIKWVGTGQCEETTRLSYIPPKNQNFAPVPRNQVDHLNATVGQLLIFSVPEDSFYDPEDGGTRNMKLSLITMDRQRVPSNHWLRFDSKNQEFYGIPMPVNVGQMEYQLICEDSGGLTAVDSLVVIVHPAPRVLYNVEFSIRLALDYNKFVESPPIQRAFVEKLAALFGDPTTQAIVLSGVAPGSTVITWHNKSLPTDICPDTEIITLRQVLLGDDERVTPAVVQALGQQFPVVGARLTPTGLCLGALTEISGAGETGGDLIEGPGRHDVTAVSHGDQYLIGLVIPAVVIAVMLACAGLVACILYRRRTTGKLSVRDDDDRQTFRSKGIPVIFQDELDERPEPTNKSPVIMKEEKPPAPPPEYQRGTGVGSGIMSSGGPPLATTALLSDTEDSTPYQPPPPFTTSRDSGRPKPTPTYRMPPPYVPP